MKTNLLLALLPFLLGVQLAGAQGTEVSLVTSAATGPKDFLETL